MDINMYNVFMKLSNGIENDNNPYKYLGLKEESSIEECYDAYNFINASLITLYERIPSIRNEYINMTKNLDVAYNYISHDKKEIDENKEEKINIYDIFRKLNKNNSDSPYDYLGVDSNASEYKCTFYYNRIKNEIIKFYKKNKPLEDVCIRMLGSLENAYGEAISNKDSSALKK